LFIMVAGAARTEWRALPRWVYPEFRSWGTHLASGVAGRATCGHFARGRLRITRTFFVRSMFSAKARKTTRGARVPLRVKNTARRFVNLRYGNGNSLSRRLGSKPQIYPMGDGGRVNKIVLPWRGGAGYPFQFGVRVYPTTPCPDGIKTSKLASRPRPSCSPQAERVSSPLFCLVGYSAHTNDACQPRKSSVHAPLRWPDETK